MSESFIAQQALVSPITHAGRVVYNAQRDWLETRHRRRRTTGKAKNIYRDGKFGEAACHTIQQFELTMRNSTSRYLQWAPTDTDVRVFSCANGMRITEEDQHPFGKKGIHGLNEQDYARFQLLARDKMQFGGVASNRAIYDPHNNANEEHLAVQVGGLTTIYNTGSERITVGDVILWDMPALDAAGAGPAVRIAGVPKGKLLFATAKMDPATSYDKELAEYKILYNGGGEPKPWLVMNRLHRRIIGRAYSSAKPGKPFDILLGRYMA
jgi:hypothetical protein